MSRISIGVRLTLWYLAIFALGELIFGVGMWFILRPNLFDLVDDDLENQVEDLKHFLQRQAKGAGLAQLQQDVTAAYSIEHSGDFLAVYADGEPVYRAAFLQAHPAVLLAPDQVKRTFVKTRLLEGRPFRFIFENLNVNGHTFTVEMGIPAEDVIDTLHLFRYYLFMFAPLLLLVAAASGYWMSRRALSPVDALVRTARDIGGTNLNSRLQKLNTGDELQRLSDTLNEMLDRIETAFSRVTQFTADASHELRTPVSLIRTEAELALRRSRGEDEYKESLRHILLEAERTTALIEQLLSLARADSGREKLRMEPVDLRNTLLRVVDGWRQVAAMRGLQFSEKINAEEVLVIGDESLLRRLADILLDNAFKYTPSPGSVCLSLELKAECATLVVQDSGMGIAEEEQGRIFERFYRVDKARNRSQGGSGLGLSIAQWIVAQHRGTITVESRPGAGAMFRVELPRMVAPVHSPVPA